MIITLYRGRIEAEKGYSSPVLHSCPLKEFGAKANQFLITFRFFARKLPRPSGWDQGADRGVLRGHLNQELPPVRELREGRPSGSSPFPSRRSSAPSAPSSGASPRREEFRPLLALVLIRGWRRSRSVSREPHRSNRTVQRRSPYLQWFTFKEPISDLQFGAGRKPGPHPISRQPRTGG